MSLEKSGDFFARTFSGFHIKPYRSLNNCLNKAKFKKAYGTFNNFSIITERDIKNVLTIDKLKELIKINSEILISKNSKKKFEL